MLSKMYNQTIFFFYYNTTQIQAHKKKETTLLNKNIYRSTQNPKLLSIY